MTSWTGETALQAVSQVITKLGSGEYPTEDVPCFCGITPAKDTLITRFDRYMIPHQMVMCEHCLLIRANPRMTQAAYTDFYNNEYRTIYDGFEYNEKADDNDFLFGIQVRRGVHLKEFLSQFDIPVQSVVEIGSFLGGSLLPFKETGATVYGVDCNTSAQAYAKDKGVETVSTVDELIARGVKVDLVVAMDLIEHLTDLNEIGKWAKLLNPRGKVFIYTPGLLAIPVKRAFQNAHTYQFICATLDRVMRKFGFVPDCQDDRIVSLWRYVTPEMEPLPHPTNWRRYIMEHLNNAEKRTIPPVWTQSKFTENHMLENLRENLSHRLPSIVEIMGKFKGPCMVVGGGPSVDGQLDKIKELQAQGMKLLVIERMYPWATQQGLTVDYVVSLDASEGVETGFTHMQKDAIHLLVATTNPKIFPIVEGYRNYVWAGQAAMLPEAREEWEKNGYKKLIIVNTGGSVTLGSIFLALMLGHRNIHLFGFDCMVPSTDKQYATGIAGESVDRTYLEVETNGQTVLTCTAFLAFAQQFFSMMETARQWGMPDSVDIYGESLVNKMWDRSGVVKEVVTEASLVPSG